MIIRLRTADGPVVRLAVDSGTTLREVKQRILADGHTDEVDVELASDPAAPHGAYGPDSATLLALGVAHGDMLCVVRSAAAASGGSVVQGGAWDASRPKANEGPLPEPPARHLVKYDATDATDATDAFGNGGGGGDGGSERHGNGTATADLDDAARDADGVFSEREYERARATYQTYQEEVQRRKRKEMLDRRGMPGMRGMTVDYIEWLDASKYSIKSRDDSPCKQCTLDFAAANAFQAYMLKVHDSQMRYGVLYGTVERESGVVSVAAIFEPPQHGDPTMYRPADAATSGAAIGEADRLARLLGMRRVGWVFAHRAEQREHALTARDIGMAAEMQLGAERRGDGASAASSDDGTAGSGDSNAPAAAGAPAAADIAVGGADGAGADSGDADARADADAFAHFVTIAVSIQSDGERHFEAYQLSEQCVQMARAGVLMPTSNSGEIRTLEPVRVEASEMSAIDTDFFLVVVPIAQHESGALRTAFPIENRELEPQAARDVKRAIDSAPGASLFTARIADFHLLLFLSRILDMDTDMPALANAVRERRELYSHEEGFKVLIESLS